MRASARRALVALGVAAALPLGASRAAAQSLPLKRTFVGATAGVCPSFTPPTPAPAASVEEARRLFSLGQEASIVGDHRGARDLFRRAQELNGTDERIAYYLARSDEELNQNADAVAQYCRYLALAANGADAEDVRARLDRLTAPAAARGSASTAGRRAAAAARFQAGVAAADRGRLSDAERAFGDVVTQVPGAAEGYYNRGVVRAGQRNWAGAEDDFARYVALSPNAVDAPAVRERIPVLRRAATSPATAFAGGLVVPGFGQFYTGRPLLGVAVLAGTAGGVLYALKQETRTITVRDTTPFGQPYTYQKEVTERSHLTTGVSAAAAVALVGAIEAFGYARQRRSAAARFAAGDLGGEQRRVAVWVAPEVARAEGAVGVRLVAGGRLSF